MIGVLTVAALAAGGVRVWHWWSAPASSRATTPRETSEAPRTTAPRSRSSARHGPLGAARPSAPSPVEGAEPVTAPADTPGDELPPWATATIEGRVTDARGAAVADAEVIGYGARPARAHSDRAGRFRVAGVALERPRSFPVGIEGSAVALSVTSPGLLEATLDLDDLRPDETRHVDVVLEAGGAVRGHVSDAHGEPLAGVTVWCDLLEPERRPTSPAARLARGSGRERGESDRSGRFEVAPLVPGRYNLIAAAAGKARRTFGPFTVTADRTTEGIELALEDGAAITLQVADRAGKPIVGAVISAFPGGDRGSSGSAAASSDNQGGVELSGLEPGTYEVEVVAERYARITLPGVSAGGPTLDVRLDPAARLVGRVVDAASGAPVKRFSVGHTAFHDADGGFEFADLPEKPEPIEVLADGYAPTTIGPFGAASGAKLDAGTVRLAKAASLRGRVVDPRGEPVVGANVHAAQIDDRRAPTSRPLSADSDTSGRFALDGLAAGRWGVSAGENGSFLPSGTVVVARSGGETRDVEIRVGELPGMAELLRTSIHDELVNGGAIARGPRGDRAVAVVSDALARVYERGLVTGDAPSETNAWLDAARSEIPPGALDREVESVLSALREGERGGESE
ncbi:MAG: carboxypeptidase regulatory-like domain-containing protein [Deltaproteobacteria bacterium]|nr:carboxypeptidase regulatory-like domain-containing protein [Deltaproteobacteria bacterium]